MTQSKMDRYFNVSFNVNKFNPVEVKFDSNIEHNLELFNLLPMINACAINSLLPRQLVMIFVIVLSS